jgi:hypothetical protein
MVCGCGCALVAPMAVWFVLQYEFAVVFVFCA